MIPPPPGIGISRAWITRGRDLQAKIVQTKPSSPSKPNHPSVMSIYSLTYIHWTFFVSSLLSKLNCFFSLWNSTMFFPTSPPNPTKFLSSLSIQSQRCLSPAFIKTSLSCSFPASTACIQTAFLSILFFPSHSYLDSAERNKIVSPINHYFE